LDILFDRWACFTFAGQGNQASSAKVGLLRNFRLPVSSFNV
jgi:hypothetical protein